MNLLLISSSFLYSKDGMESAECEALKKSTPYALSKSFQNASWVIANLFFFRNVYAAIVFTNITQLGYMKSTK